MAEKVLRGEAGAVSKALSLVTDEAPGHEPLLAELFRRRRDAHKIGVCGPPGSGKSTLVNRLIGRFRSAGEKVGVLAVDPSSPFTGGAFLGDRLRVQEHALDAGVFMRSLATRGMLGGLSPTIFGAVHVLEAAGFSRILIETVGTGQDEVEIARLADTVLCVSAPYQGDEFQAMKAGTMEIADLFVVNKADLAGIDKAVASLKDALGLKEDAPGGWKVPVLPVSALTGDGLDALMRGIEAHRGHLGSSPEGLSRLKTQLRWEVAQLLSRRIYQDAVRRIREEHLEALLKRETDPATLGARMLGTGGEGASSGATSGSVPPARGGSA